MRKLLRLDASAQGPRSHSRGLADHYETRWRQRHPGGEVVTRDLARDPIPHLDEATLAVLSAGGDASEAPPPPGIVLSDRLIEELKHADDLLISSAVYNFNMPSALKAWIDHIVRFGHTVTYGDTGPVGLLLDKRACLITARGGTAQHSPDYQVPAMQAVLGYIGVRETQSVALEGTRLLDGELEARVSTARATIDDLFESGAFS